MYHTPMLYVIVMMFIYITCLLLVSDCFPGIDNIMTEDKSTKPEGRPPKRDLSYVKLLYFNDGIDVNEWIGMAEEFVTFLGHNGEEAAGYILYHIRGGAKIELSMLGEGMLSKEVIFKRLRNRGTQKRARRERLRVIVERRQGEEEGITSFADGILILELELKEDVDGWESLMVDTFKSNVWDPRLRMELLLTGDLKIFSHVRERARLFESVSEEGRCGYEVRAVKVDRVDRVDCNDSEEIKRLCNRVRELESRRMNSGDRQGEIHVELGRPMVRCYRCGRVGHTSR